MILQLIVGGIGLVFFAGCFVYLAITETRYNRAVKEARERIVQRQRIL